MHYLWYWEWVVLDIVKVVPVHALLLTTSVHPFVNHFNGSVVKLFDTIEMVPFSHLEPPFCL